MHRSAPQPTMTAQRAWQRPNRVLLINLREATSRASIPV
jgi:hypothetical protein